MKGPDRYFATKMRTLEYLKDYHYQVNHSFNTDNNFISKGNNNQIAYPISFVLSYDTLSKNHLTYTLVISNNSEPQHYIEANKQKVN